MVVALTYAQWKAKHANSPKYASLSKAAAKQRYQDYLSSFNATGGPRSKYAPKKNKVPSRSPSAQLKGRAAVQKLSNSLGFVLNPKTHDFLTARSNPFCPRIRDVGYPQPTVGGSLKWRSFARGTLSTNAAGYGQITLNPGITGFSDLLAISYSRQTNTMVSDTIVVPDANFTSVGMQGAPFTSAGIPGNKNFTYVRLNALGVRIRSDAALMSKAGSIKTFCLPLMDTDCYSLTGAQLLTDYAKYCSWYQANTADTPWFSSVFSPAYPLLPQRISPTDYDVWQQESGSMPSNNLSVTQASATMGILISGAPTTTFDFEVVGWHELYGAAIIGSSFSTPTYVDPLGQAVVEGVTQQASFNTMVKTDSGGVSATEILSAIGTAAKSVAGIVDAPSLLKSFMSGSSSNVSLQAPPAAGANLEGAAADADSLAARLAGLQMPSVPGSVSVTSELSSNIPEALEVLAL